MMKRFIRIYVNIDGDVNEVDTKPYKKEDALVEMTRILAELNGENNFFLLNGEGTLKDCHADKPISILIKKEDVQDVRLLAEDYIEDE